VSAQTLMEANSSSMLPQGVMDKLSAHEKIVLGLGIEQEVERLYLIAVGQIQIPMVPWRIQAWRWLKPRLAQFCNSWDEWHAVANGALWPTICIIVWTINGRWPLGQMWDSVRDEAAYVGVGIALRWIVLGALYACLA